MKRWLCLIQCLFMIFLMFGCGCQATQESAETQPPHMLQGKKFIIIGNSHTYNGKVVLKMDKSVLEQSARSNDMALFYQLCKANGAEVSVTNWCFSGHGLQHLFGNPCGISACNGVKHEDYLTDRFFDYVVITPGVGENSVASLEEDIAYITNFFREANPNVKFVCLGNASVYGKNRTDEAYPGITNYYKTLEEQGFLIADWGMVVSDLIDGYSSVPGTKEQYTKNTFIVSDGFHPNVLSGYVASMMLYCVITDEAAVDQPRRLFVDDPTMADMVSNQLKNSYEFGDLDTNFHKILTSESELEGLQIMVDQYLEDKPYRISLEQ